MGLPGVEINVSNGNLGRTPGTEDGITGMILSGTAISGLALNAPKAVFTLKEAENLGLAASRDAHSTVKEFYRAAGDGAELWLMLVADTVTLAEMTDSSEPYAPALISAAKGRIRILAIDRVPGASYTPDQTAGIDKDVYDAAVSADELAKAETAKVNPLRVIIGGRAFSGDVSQLHDLKTWDRNRVQILMGSASKSGRPAIGLLTGTYARLPVQRNPGRVKNGSLPVTAAYLTDGSLQSAGDLTKVEAVHKKGYVAIRQFTGKAGFYFTDDPTATSDADDCSSFARGRVIDKAYLLAYKTYIEEVNDEIEVDGDGKIDAARLKELEAKIENTVNQQMTANGEISSVEAAIDTEQNVLATDKIEIGLNITPVGYMKQIIVNLGFENPFNS